MHLQQIILITLLLHIPSDNLHTLHFSNPNLNKDCVLMAFALALLCLGLWRADFAHGYGFCLHLLPIITTFLTT